MWKLIRGFPKATKREWQDWRWQFKNRLTRPDAAIAARNTSPSLLDELRKTAAVYPQAITPYYYSLINQDDPDDPIMMQSFPSPREIIFSAQSSEDPLNEDSFMPVPKLLHRYPDRCLALVTEICATYCRHCNRKRFWSSPAKVSFRSRLAHMIRYISSATEVREVIISGGDPLTMDDDALEALLSSLRAIPHVEVLRIGSRAPVVIPMRINQKLCRILKRYRPVWFNTQFNHVSEITAESQQACNMLQEAGIPVSNQSVLLAGVNDSTEKMKQLLYGLQKISVRPYYLFHCEPVKGCEHFRTDLKTGLKIMENIWRQCSGLSLPQYVMDLPGTTGKFPLNIMSGMVKKDLQKHKHFFDKSK